MSDGTASEKAKRKSEKRKKIEAFLLANPGMTGRAAARELDEDASYVCDIKAVLEGRREHAYRPKDAPPTCESTSAVRRRVVEFLTSPENSMFNNDEVASILGVNSGTVARVRRSNPSLPKFTNEVQQRRRYVLDFLSMPDHAALPATEVARRLGVTPEFVRSTRKAHPYGDTTLLKIANIRQEPDAQPRVEMKEKTIDAYAADMESGDKFPPVTVFYDGQNHWLADGFQRVAAAQKLGLQEIEADVKMGDLDDAIRYSFKANATHGVRRSDEDKKRAIEVCHRRWPALPNTEIARYCVVTNQYVSKVLRSSSSNQLEDSPVKTVTRGGKTYTMRTSGIGRKPSSNGDGTSEDSSPSTGQSKVNGVLVADPPDVAKARAEGRIAPGVVPEVDEPDETTSVDDVREEIEEHKAKTETDLSDEDWLATLPLWGDQAIDRRKLRVDALIYRRMESARRKWKHAIEDACRDLPGAKRAAYYWKFTTPLRADDPTRLVKCSKAEYGGCDGTGTNPQTGECPKCYGRGYRING